MRTCIGCRTTVPREELLRVVAMPVDAGDPTGGLRLVVDDAARLPGRGAWIHPRTSCCAKAVKRKAFGRALRVPHDLDVAPLVERLAGHDPLET